MPFDPDAYVAKLDKQKSGFDPDAYLAKKGLNEPSVADKAYAGLKDLGQGASDLVRNQVTNANSAIQATANGLTQGYMPQMEGGLSAAGSAAVDALHGDFDRDKILKDYIAARDHAVASQKQFHDDAPAVYNTAEFGGAMASPANEVLAPFKAVKEAGLLKKIAAGAGNGALMGAAMNPGDKAGDISPLQLGARGTNSAWGAGLGGLVTGGVEGVKSGWKKGMTTLFGPNEEAINKYVAGRDRINQAPNVATLKDTIDQQVGGLNKAVADGQLNVVQAKSDLANLSNQVSNKVGEAKQDWANEIPNWRDSVQNVNQELGRQTDQLEKSIAVPHPREMAPDVHQAVGTLKDQVVAESQASHNIIANSNIGVQTQPVMQALDDAIQDKFIAGHGPITTEGKATVAGLEEMKKDLIKYPAILSGGDAKRFVQQLDKGAKYNNQAGQFGDDYSNAIKDARRAVDTQMKGYKPYEDQMKVVAEKTDLLNRANKVFGTPEKAHGAMNTIMGEGKAPQQELLHELGVHTGNDFATPLTNYQKAQDTLKNGMGPLVEKLPAQQGIKTGKFIGDILPQLKDNYVDTVLRESGLPAQHTAQQAELARVQAALEGAKQKAAPFSAWSQQNSQNKIQSMVSRDTDRASIEAGRELEALDALRAKAPLDPMKPNGDPSYMQSIDDNRVRNQFSRDQTRGARNALIWHGIGMAGGGAVGALVPGMYHIPMAIGGGIGTVAGGAVDKYGGQMAKGMLDHYLDNPELYKKLSNTQPNKVVAPWLMLRKKDEQ